MKPTFQDLANFRSGGAYRLLPFNFARLGNTPEGTVLVTNDMGDFAFLNDDEFKKFTSRILPPDQDLYADLKARSFLADDQNPQNLELLAIRYRSKKSFIGEGPSLHIFVVTLRCDHSCLYCQVSRQGIGAEKYDMSFETVAHAVDRVFESPSPHLTIEFQGGEPALAFATVRRIVELAEARNATEGRNLQFSMVSTLHLLDHEMLVFCRDHAIALSTSLDGPESIHNAARRNRTGDSYQRTIDSLARAREIVGADAISALTTLSKESLKAPREIIDLYVELGFRSIFLRPLAPYGFAAQAKSHLSYSVDDFVAFYQKALNYLIELNVAGVDISEVYTSILLRHILTPFPSTYLDLRSPASPGLGVRVYNYDATVYASDEARMVAETGDKRFALGNVSDSARSLFTSDAMQWLLAAGINEALPGCSDCAYQPYCGADPIFHASRQGDPVGHRPTSEFCQRHLGVFDVLFSMLAKRDPNALRVFMAWTTGRSVRELPAAGYLG